MFHKILIANRGEIAVRIAKTARKMGVRTVAVYSDADADALHVRLCDEAVRLGPAPVADSYLRGDLMIQAALDTGAQAIHPGYGFLSENPDFVDAITAAGLTFIGPSADAIRKMGLKDAAKALMERAGVPVVPGYHGADQTGLAAQADKIGYPVLIKAVAGGGGKGMRLVETADAFGEALASAQAEAKTAFGNADVLIEKYIQQPRHIEVQVFGDGTNAVHLYERDCSLQRRHQKVIEEAPAPGMTQDMRTAMGDAAVRAAQAIGYAGAGTIEFIVDASKGLRADGFWFMEMNTRLQVEHPVTEAVTGIDLVDWQLRVAAGASLPMTQDQITLTGHAFEARLYAEDATAGFLPATGTLAHLNFPIDARIDSGVETGSEISPWYDPMIAKVTVHGTDRTHALRKLSAALAGTEVAGCTTNVGFLQRLAAHPDFAAGDVDTGLIARHQDSLCKTVTPRPEHIGAAVLAATGLADSMPQHAGFTLWDHAWQVVTFEERDVEYRVTNPGQVTIRHDDQDHELTRSGQSWRLKGKPLPNAGRHADVVTVYGTAPCAFTMPDPLASNTAELGGDDIRAPMPGLVQSVDVATGASVMQGDRMVVMEAMKMEHVLRAPRDGIVAEVSVATGAQVAAGDVLIKLEGAE